MLVSWTITILVAVGLCTADLIRIPLTQRTSRGTDAKRLARRSVGFVQLVDEVVLGGYTDLAYYGEVNIGSPPQSFLVRMVPRQKHAELVIDSGSGTLWVADVDCVGCNVSDARLFDPKRSASSRNLNIPIEVIYGQGIHTVDVVDVGAIDCAGYNDTVEFGGISMAQFTFGSCSQENDFFYLTRYSRHNRSK